LIVRRALVVTLALAVPCAAPRVEAQTEAARLEIVASTDTTMTFRTGERRWIVPGLAGTIVDPRERDTLVGRFVVASVGDQFAIGSLTGLATRVRVEHVALLVPPRQRWFRQRLFWIGSALGALTAAATALVVLSIR
jgi:hypothetical protein